MSSHDSLPPVSATPRKRRAPGPRWLWIPGLLVLPAAIWAVVHLQKNEVPPAPEASLADATALHVLANPQPVPTVDPAPQPEPTTRPTTRSDDEAGDEEGADADDSAGDEGTDDDDVAVAASEDDDGSAEAEGDKDGAEAGPETLGEGIDYGFWIQVASLRLKEKADRLASRLRKRGHDARALAYGGPRAGWWHVVRIGPYVTRLEAERARLAFVDQESMPSEVLPRAHGPYYIQVASLREEARAKSLATRLSRSGHPAYVRGVPGKQGLWYCVRVGPFDFETDVLGYQKILEERDSVKGEIMPRISEPG